MNLWKALQAQQALTPEQKLFVKERMVEGTTTPDDWLVLFGKVAEYDSLRDSSSKTVGWMGCGGCAGLVLLFILGVSNVILFPIFVIALIIFIGVSVILGKHRKDVPNHLRLFVVPLLSVLREEMRRGESLYLRLDLRGGTVADKLHSNQLSKKGQQLQASGSKIKEEFFQDVWLTGSARLADGTQLQMRVVDRIRKREEGKRRSSGKYKTKTKHKIKSRLEARLQFKRAKYTFDKTGLKAATNEKVNVQSDTGKDTVRLRRTVLSTDLNRPAKLYDFLDLLAKAYKQVKPVS
ncbi:MAG: hypothetical protein AB1757_04960 [Acidobacteriota bacterium]